MRASAAARTERLAVVCSRIACATCCSRNAGLGSPTGRSTRRRHGPTAGGAARRVGALHPQRHHRPHPAAEVTGSPRESSQARSAPVTTVSTTSFTVHPWAVRTSRYAARSPRATAKRRWVDRSTLSGEPGASRPPVTTVPTSAPTPRASLAARRARRSPWPARCRPPAGPGDGLGDRVDDEAASLGSGRGIHSCVGHLARLGRVEQHLPDVDRVTPSTIAWWVFVMIANRPSARPSTR